MRTASQSAPPGKIKLMKALTHLLGQKDFNSITTAGIAGRAGVTEGLIYKYFKDKKDLLFHVLGENIQIFHQRMAEKLEKESSAAGQLKIFIADTIDAYMQNRVFGRILLLEVRNNPDYFKSSAHEMMSRIELNIQQIITRGIEAGEFKKNIDPQVLEKMIFGAIEHACIEPIIYKQNIDTAAVAAQINEIIFGGIAP